MTLRYRSFVVSLLLILPAALHAATTYRVTITTSGRFHSPPAVRRIIADGPNRRLTVEKQEEPFTFDVLLSTDGGRTVTALNTGLRTWYEFVPLPATDTGEPPWIPTEVRDTKLTLAEEASAETIEGFPMRKFVIHASYTSREDHGGTKVNRVHVMTALLWTTDKLDRSFAFPLPEVLIGVRSIDAALREKTASIPGFPLRQVTTISRSYEGGAPAIELTTIDAGDVHTMASPAASAFVKPAGYVHQEPVIGAPGKS